jgi:hypothetical protein
MLIRKLNIIITLIFFLLANYFVASQNPSLSVDNGKLIYNTDGLGNKVLDFSFCGYQNSEEDIPLIENKIFVPHCEGNSSQVIQQAIDFVETLPLDASGFRGSVLLDRGIFTLDESLVIHKSGVVLRGTGKNETVLRKNGVDRNAFIKIEGLNNIRYIDTLLLLSNYVPVNSHILGVDRASHLKKGDKIIIYRPSTASWIKKLGCDHFGGGITALGWKEGDIDIYWDRTITEIKNNTVKIDAPLSMALNANDAACKIFVYEWPGRISNCGIENLLLESDYDSTNLKDEDHCWTAVSVENASDCWIRRIHFRNFAGSVVILQPTASKITVEDCIATNPVSEIGGMRRNTFLTMGQLNLFQRCYSEKGIHDFGAGFCAPGPNAFVQCETMKSYSYSGAIDSWACGLLFDIVDIDGNDLVYKNLGQNTNGAGWGTSNSMFWQCTASGIECYSPSCENINRAYGCWGQFAGNGEWHESNNHIQPRSLFYAQLSERLGKDFSERARILPLNTSSTSSPTVELAMQLAQEAYKPRLTLREWIEDSLCLPTFYGYNLKSIDQLKENSALKPGKMVSPIDIKNGKISIDDRLITGGRIEVQWWNGKLRNNYLSKAKPHITRFVPGREGLGLTDRIDSVISFMNENHIAVLDHNYGLWYDRRRDDHQRVRRKNGEVWGPFYEQAFARSGKGTAWDGLSKYDLNKPNAWYWSRLKEFADKGAQDGILLFHENYFQHNILEAGAHWVDCPWRTANNINNTGFPEPVPFAGDKRIFMADMFYDITHPIRKELHKKYIRQCLDAFAENKNVVQLTGAEFTGPLHFVQFWIDEIREWEKETGKDALIALSATKDVQDAILSDPERASVVDIIDIRYWHYKDNGSLYAPEGGKNLSPRQHARLMKVGKVTFKDAYRAVKEYREMYPQKAVTYFAQNYPEMAWAIFMAGGSLPCLPPIDDPSFLEDALKMDIVVKESEGCYQLEEFDTGAIIYLENDFPEVLIPLESGLYQLKSVNEATGKVSIIENEIMVKNQYTLHPSKNKDKIYWFKRISR